MIYSASFYFELSFQGEDAAFQEASGISKELNVEEVVCGGENRFKYRLPTVSTSQNLVLKRAFLVSGSKLMNWCASSLDQGMAVAIQPHDVSLSLLAKSGQVSKKWTFYNAYPVKYSISEFKSSESGIVMESIELAYTYFQINSKTTIDGLFK